MALKLKLIHLSQLDTIVIKQSGGHFFVSTPNSFIIDKAGYLQLLKALLDIGFVTYKEVNDATIDAIIHRIGELKDEDEKNGGDSNLRGSGVGKNNGKKSSS